LVLRVGRARPGLPERLVRMALQARLDRRALRVGKARPGLQASRARRALRVIRVPLV